jgi:peroxiredoxin
MWVRMHPEWVAPWGRFAEAASKTNERLPDYRLMSLERREIGADELRKGRVLIVYLTTNCKACIKEAEVISSLQHDLPPDFRIYGVSIERPAQVEAFAREFNLTFPFLIDTEAKLARALDIHRFPSKYLVQDGVITKVWRGTTQNPAELREQLDIK